MYFGACAMCGDETYDAHVKAYEAQRSRTMATLLVGALVLGVLVLVR